MEHVIKGSTELNKMFAALQRTTAGLRRDFGEVEKQYQQIKEFIGLPQDKYKVAIIKPV